MAGLKVFCDVDLALGSVVVLPKAEAHHLIQVARVKPDEKVFVLNGRGVVGCGYLQMEEGVACIKILGVDTYAPARPRVILMQALPMGRVVEDILRQSVELGIAEFWPIISERTQYVAKEDRMNQRQERWLGIVREACKQSHNPYMPLMRPVGSLVNCLKELSLVKNENIRLVASLQNESKPLKEYLSINKDEIIIAIGPEGDFTSAEYEALGAAGFLPARLTQTILRSQTATIVALSAVKIFATN
jgi:16S rRNA (uracil1498-N3)-methyltransferase